MSRLEAWGTEALYLGLPGRLVHVQAGSLGYSGRCTVAFQAEWSKFRLEAWGTEVLYLGLPGRVEKVQAGSLGYSGRCTSAFQAERRSSKSVWKWPKFSFCKEMVKVFSMDALGSLKVTNILGGHQVSIGQ